MHHTPHSTPTSPTTKSPLAILRRLVPTRSIHRSEHAAVAELQANHLRRQLHATRPRLDTDAIQRLAFLDVRHDAELHTSGMSFWNGHRWIVLLNPGEPDVRQRFTLLHELHHIISHPSGHRLFRPSGTHHPQAERMADTFAACALMPKRHVKRLYGQGKRTVGELAAAFDVSEPAMRFRLDTLGLQPVDTAQCGYSHRSANHHRTVAA